MAQREADEYMQAPKTPVELFQEAEIVIADTGDIREGYASRESRREAPPSEQREENKKEEEHALSAGATQKTGEDGKEKEAPA